MTATTTSPTDFDSLKFRVAVQGLERGDFSRLEPLFSDPASGGRRCDIVEWCEAGYFAAEPRALAEALTCACFLGRTGVVDFLLNRGVDPTAGSGTGLNGFHWAPNRGQFDTVMLFNEKYRSNQSVCMAELSWVRPYGLPLTSRGLRTCESSRR
jgi:hypothetical protein